MITIFSMAEKECSALFDQACDLAYAEMENLTDKHILNILKRLVIECIYAQRENLSINIH